MINNISWTSYWYAILAMALIYYSIVILIYFNQEIKGLIWSGSRQHSHPNIVSSPDAPSKTNSLLPENKLEDDSIASNTMQDEICAYFIQSSGKAGNKNTIISDLIHIRRKYPQVETNDRQEGLKKFVLWACENNCAVTLSEDDIERVWKG